MRCSIEARVSQPCVLRGCLRAFHDSGICSVQPYQSACDPSRDEQQYIRERAATFFSVRSRNVLSWTLRLDHSIILRPKVL